MSKQCETTSSYYAAYRTNPQAHRHIRYDDNESFSTFARMLKKRRAGISLVFVVFQGSDGY